MSLDIQEVLIGGLPMVSGRMYESQALSDNGAGAAVTANRMYASPFLVFKPTTFTKMGFRCTATDAGKKARAGVYSDSDGVPGSLFVQTGDIDVSTATGGLSAAFTGGDVVVPPGWYWLAAVSDGVAQVHYASANDNLRWIGCTTFNDTVAASGVYVTTTFSTTGVLPATFGSVTYNAAAIPFVRIEVT